MHIDKIRRGAVKLSRKSMKQVLAPHRRILHYGMEMNATNISRREIIAIKNPKEYLEMIRTKCWNLKQIKI